MRNASMSLLLSVFGMLLWATPHAAHAGWRDRGAKSYGKEVNLNDLPIAVIEAAQKEVPGIAFMKAEVKSARKGGETYKIWGMDKRERQITLEVHASGKIIERPKVVKETSRSS